MLLERLNLERFRGFDAVELRPSPGINLIVGGNGAGKTTLLEAAHLLATGRSFRGRVREGLIQHGKVDLEVFAEWRETTGRLRRAGLRHTGRDWQARLDGESVRSLADLCAAVAVLSFEPGSHELIAGGSETRRRFLDWALFHVEPDFLPLWRRYSRALKQRNVLLKGRSSPEQLSPWERELEDSGEPLTRMRASHLAQIEALLIQTSAIYLPEFGEPRLEFLPGWQRQDFSLGEALTRAWGRDSLLGHTGQGPHRADWRISWERLPGRHALSRGQQKLAALACVMAQGGAYAISHGDWPIVALDDLASELDQEHQRRVLVDLEARRVQVLLTSNEKPASMQVLESQPTMFHVEQGEIRHLL